MHAVFTLFVLIALLHLVIAPPLSSVSKFTCVLGQVCKMKVMEFDMPITPSVRISDDLCGFTTGSAVFTFVGPPDVIFDIGLLFLPILTLAPLHICLASATLADPNFSSDWGTLDVVGPNPTTLTECYFGSQCRPVISGNKLGSTRSLVFYVDDTDACADGVADPIYGLSNDPGAWVIPSTDATQATYSTLGIVSPTLSVDTTLQLCWTTYLAGTLPVPISLGLLTLTGPVDANSVFACTLGGGVCTITPTDPNVNIAGSSIIISDSGTGCEIYSTGLVWGTTDAIVTYDTHFSMGTPSAANEALVKESSVCWMHDVNSPLHRVPIGVFTMYGPTSGVNEVVCYAGISCTVTLNGIYEALTSSSLIVRYTNCASGLVDIPSATNTVGASNVNAIDYNLLVGIGADSTPKVLCWEHSTHTVSIQAGSLLLAGPQTQTATIDCELSNSCQVSIPFMLPTEGTEAEYLQNQKLQFIQSSTTLEDPCLSIGTPSVTVSAESSLADYNSFTGLTQFRFQSINTAVDNSAVVRSVCWSLPNYPSDRAVYIGLWEPVGPHGGMQVTSTWGQLCTITIDPYPEYVPDNLFFLTNNDSDCLTTNYVVKNLATFSGTNPAVNVNGVAIFSFGTPTGSGNQVFTICYSQSNRFRRGSPLGTVTFI